MRLKEPSIPNRVSRGFCFCDFGVGRPQFRKVLIQMNLKLFILCCVLAAPFNLNAGDLAKPSSENFCLARLTPNGGQAQMASTNFKMEAVILPRFSGVMSSERFRIQPTPGPLVDQPGVVGFAEPEKHEFPEGRVVLVLR